MITALIGLLVIAVAVLIYLYAELAHGLSFTLKTRTPPPAAPGLACDRRRLDAVVSLTDWRRR